MNQFIKNNKTSIVLLLLSWIVLISQIGIIISTLLLVIELAILMIRYHIRNIISLMNKLTKTTDGVINTTKRHLSETIYLKNYLKLTNMKKLKFLRVNDEIKMGWVEFHSDLISKRLIKPEIKGGGIVLVDQSNKTITFTGHSVDFGYINSEWLKEYLKINKADIYSDIDLLFQLKIDNIESYKLIVNIDYYR